MTRSIRSLEHLGSFQAAACLLDTRLGHPAIVLRDVGHLNGGRRDSSYGEIRRYFITQTKARYLDERLAIHLSPSPMLRLVGWQQDQARVNRL